MKNELELRKQLLITETELLKTRSQVLQLLHDKKLDELAIVEAQIVELSKEEGSKNKNNEISDHVAILDAKINEFGEKTEDDNKAEDE